MNIGFPLPALCRRSNEQEGAPRLASLASFASSLASGGLASTPFSLQGLSATSVIATICVAYLLPLLLSIGLGYDSDLDSSADLLNSDFITQDTLALSMVR